MQSNSLREDNMDNKMFARDEFIGLDVTIKECKDPSWVGKIGHIVDETKNTFLIEIKNEKKMIAKKATTFEFNNNGKKFTLNGLKIAYRPEDRIKKIR
jgi:RNase P/RNase MRP subunit p29